MKSPLIVPLLAATLALAGCYTNPVTGRTSLMVIPAEQEITMGAQSFQEIRAKETVSSQAALNARVTRVGEKIAKAVGNELPNAKWEFVVFDSKEVNAFALPGGKVGVYSGLLALAESDAELATVMGHEIGHVIARHGAERMSESMVIEGLGALGTAAVEAKTEDPRIKQAFALAYGGGTTLLRVLPHSRANESEADRMGAIYAARAGYDPQAAITFWQKMAAQKQSAEAKGNALSNLLSTHPADEKRIADLKALMPQVMPIYEQNRVK